MGQCHRRRLTKYKNDYYRLGYVAFTRAKKLLVLSCLEELADNEIDALKELNIKSV